MKTVQFETKLGPFIAKGDEKSVYFLGFSEQAVPACLPTPPLSSIQEELTLYFDKKLKTFKTPFHLLGTPFQVKVWQELLKIPHGKTISYLELATRVGNPKACRAVARANGANPLCVLIPCHRVINKDGRLGGYSSGIHRKQWLLEHEL